MKKMTIFPIMLFICFSINALDMITIESPLEPGVLIDFDSEGTWKYHVEFIEVVDGDTVLMKYKGGNVEFDIFGIDAPELDQPYGVEAKEYLENTLQEIKISTGNIYYDNLLWEIGFEVNMVELGLAWVDTLLYLQMYQDQARREYRGLWADREPIPPWVWREEHNIE